MDSTRQNKIARLLQKELSEYFLLQSKVLYMSKMISVTSVRVTPDLAEAKVHISIYPSDNSATILQAIEEQYKKIRFEVGNKIKNQVRRIPELKFFIDDSLDYTEKIENLLKQ